MRRVLGSVVLLICIGNQAQAHSHYSGRYGPAHSFSTSYCKTSSCFHKHPSGSYVHPNTGHERRPG